MLTLRLQRAGKKNKPEFRIVLAQKEAAASKKFLEILGNYNPRTKEFSVKDESRLKYWVEQHVQISPTLNNLLVSKNLISAPKQKAFLVPTKVKAKKAEAEVKAKAEADAETAKAAAAVSEPAAEESVTTEPTVEPAAPEEPVAEAAPAAEEPAPAETPAEPAA
jgi:small subunit ribosomal protein S16